MSDFWFDNLDDFDMGDFESPSKGMDRYLSGGENPDSTPLDSRIASAEGRDKKARVKVSSPDDLDGFHRIADTDKLVRMSEQDLWSLEEGEEGEYVIERLFDDDGEPLKV
jgi:hypothetical protein